MWRSLVAYTSGGRRVAGSNPVIPTQWKMIWLGQIIFLFSVMSKVLLLLVDG